MLFLRHYLNIAKKIAIVFIVFFSVIALFSYFISKDKTDYKTVNKEESRKVIYQMLNDPQIKKTQEGRAVISIFRNSLCGMVGEACTDNPKDGDIYYKKSFFGSVGRLITAPYANPPASGVYWARDTLEKAGFVPKTSAATGIGFASLTPLLFLWKIFRNIAFMFLVIVLIAIGFMIMFRVKINQQVIISLENSLPKIIISMILITFSFAIVGFLIDLMYLVTSIGISLIAQNDVVKNIPALNFQFDLYSGGAATLLNNIYFHKEIMSLGPALFEIFPSVITTLLRFAIMILTLWGLSKLPTTTPTPNDSKEVTEDVPGGGFLGLLIKTLFLVIFIPMVGYLVPYILSIILVFLTGLIVFFRIFFIIFKAYIKILIFTIFSPLVMLVEAIPGRNIFSKWFKSLVAELSVFPVVILLMMVSNLIIMAPISIGELWQPPFLGTSSQQIGPWGFKILVGIGILYMIPELVKLVKQGLGVKEEGRLGGLGVYFGGIASPAKGGLHALSQFGYARHGFDGAKNFFGKLAGKFGDRKGGAAEQTPSPTPKPPTVKELEDSWGV